MKLDWLEFSYLVKELNFQMNKMRLKILTKIWDANFYLQIRQGQITQGVLVNLFTHTPPLLKE